MDTLCVHDPYALRIGITRCVYILLVRSDLIISDVRHMSNTFCRKLRIYTTLIIYNGCGTIYIDDTG